MRRLERDFTILQQRTCHNRERAIGNIVGNQLWFNFQHVEGTTPSEEIRVIGEHDRGIWASKGMVSIGSLICEGIDIDLV